MKTLQALDEALLLYMFDLASNINNNFDEIQHSLTYFGSLTGEIVVWLVKKYASPF